MPWKECNPIDERLKFVARRLDGEKMDPLCRENRWEGVLRAVLALHRAVNR